LHFDADCDARIDASFDTAAGVGGASAAANLRWHFGRRLLIPNPLGIARLSPKTLTVLAAILTFNHPGTAGKP
jgi:hypothetical protein